MRTKEEGIKALRPAEKLSEVQKSAIVRFEMAVESFAGDIYDNVPECADRTHAIRCLLDCKMTGIQAISHHGFDFEGKVKEHVKKETK